MKATETADEWRGFEYSFELNKITILGKFCYVISRYRTKIIKKKSLFFVSCLIETWMEEKKYDISQMFARNAMKTSQI